MHTLPLLTRLLWGLLPLAPAPLLADMSFDEMMHEKEVEERSLTEEEFAAVQRRLDAEREAERRRSEQQQRDAALRLEAERQRLAARPLGEQLVEARCSSCHPAEQVASARHARPGWHFTVVRMRYWHGAELTWLEHGFIVDHLTQTQPAVTWRAVAEYALLAAFLTAPLAWWLRQRRQRFDRTNSPVE